MLDVIGVGFGRTGTFSLKHALEQLGFGPCHHGFELLLRPERAPLWHRALDGEVLWDELFAGYRSTTDSPGMDFWRELVEFYPDAKVVLTVRDPGRWYDSLLTLAEHLSDPKLLTLLRERVPWFTRGSPMYDGVDVTDRNAMVAHFERHTEQVRATVPAERLLVFEVSQGWEPLCEFLDVNVPEAEFPRRNDTEELGRLISEATSG